MASAQIDGAVWEFADGNFISAHTLAAAAAEVVNDVARARKGATNSLLVERELREKRPDDADRIRSRMRRPQNFAKHARRDSADEIAVRPELTALLMFQTVIDHAVVFRRQSFRQCFYRAWFISRHPELVADENPAVAQAAREVFPDAVETDIAKSLAGFRSLIVTPPSGAVEFFESSATAAEVDWSSGLSGCSPEKVRRVAAGET